MPHPSAFRALTLVLCAAGGLVAGCGPKTKPSAVSAESHAPGTTLASTPAACAAYPVGAAGVVRTFCDGTAKVKLTVNGVDHLLTGGACSTTGGVFSLNLGVVAGPGLAGPKPDYVGLTTQVAAGPFTDAVLTVNIGGKGYVLTQNSGEVSPTGGTFQGVARHKGPKISATFTC
ncbi:MAG: hypothetical protein P4L64_15895 [Caulobacteraceae bacterium]|nr:hypothetical protein [Caulobacteraceae bacterium]